MSIKGQMATRVLLIRHGETDWSNEGRYQGWTDTRLSARGRRQMKKLAVCLKEWAIGSLYSSGLKRAEESAKFISDRLRLKPRADKRMNEFHFGAWEGKTARELLAENDLAFKSWAGGVWKRPKGGEAISGFKKRVTSFLSHILKKENGKTVAVVAHGGSIRMFMAAASGRSFRSMRGFQIHASSLSVLDFSGRRARIARLNDISHLSGTGSGSSRFE